MTTPAAANLYRAQHLLEMEGKRWAVHNPKNLPREDLPVIYGFNNGGSSGWYTAQLIAEDGTGMGSHLCSHEAYMENDLGILEGTRPDRHEKFKKYYPDGYQMHFISHKDVEHHEGLKKAYELNQQKGKEADANKQQKQGG